MSQNPMDNVQSAFEQLPEQLQIELRDHCMEGNSHRELAEMFFTHLSREQLEGFVNDYLEFRKELSEEEGA